MNVTKKKYGLWTGLAMVIGTVLGCGVFIKAGSVLNASGGSLTVALLAWLIGGIIMVASGFCFAVYATRIEKFNGCVDYVEYASNKHVGAFFGYYLGMIYFPIVGSHVAIIAGRYLVKCFTVDEALSGLTSYPVMIVAILLIIIFFLVNYFSSKISSRYQVSVLFVKLAPIIFVAVVGAFAPLINKDFPGIVGAFSTRATPTASVQSFGEAIKITAFAYDGWIAAAALNAEMKDSKKNLPRALIGGTIALVIFYIIYFIGLSAVLGNQEVISKGDLAASTLFSKIFGLPGAYIFTIFIFLSCTGNINSMTICASRSLIALGVRNEGFMPRKMRETKNDNFTLTPYLVVFITMMFYLLIWWLAYSKISIFKYLETMDEIVCAIVFAAYIFVYIYMMKNFKDENVIIRFVMPIIAIIGSAFFTFCGMGLYQLIFNRNPESLYAFFVLLALCILVNIPMIILHYKKRKNNI